MPSWNPAQYLLFAEQRTQPCRDLAARINLKGARPRIADLGCGPGNSTEVIAARWPKASITGVDSSAEMIATARAQHPEWKWQQADIATWKPAKSCDLIFSNAALQWVPDHATLLPRHLAELNPGGAMALQIPINLNAPAHTQMRELATSRAWRNLFPHAVREWHADDPAIYYDILAPHAARLEIWTTEYLHIMPNVEAICDWYKGTGLRPFLDALPDDSLRDQFLAEYLERLRTAYPERADGQVLFPFLRLFVIAYRGQADRRA